MRSMWPKLKAIADTRPYDGAIVRDNQRGKPQPTKRWAPVTIPALVVDGRKSLTDVYKRQWENMFRVMGDIVEAARKQAGAREV